MPDGRRRLRKSRAFRPKRQYALGRPAPPPHMIRLLRTDTSVTVETHFARVCHPPGRLWHAGRPKEYTHGCVLSLTALIRVHASVRHGRWHSPRGSPPPTACSPSPSWQPRCWPPLPAPTAVWVWRRRPLLCCPPPPSASAALPAAPRCSVGVGTLPLAVVLQQLLRRVQAAGAVVRHWAVELCDESLLKP